MLLDTLCQRDKSIDIYSWRNFELDVGGKVQQQQFIDEFVVFLLQGFAERPNNDSRPGTGLSIQTPV